MILSVSLSEAFEITGKVDIHVTVYDGDELVMTVNSLKKGYCSFIDNWDPDWTAKRNGQHIEIERLFYTFKSVKINHGTNRIEFRYSLPIFDAQ